MMSFRAAPLTAAVMLMLASTVSADNALLPGLGEVAVGSGGGILEGNESEGTLQGYTFSPLSQSSGRVLMLDAGLDLRWSESFNGLEGSAFAGLVRRSTLSSGAVLGLNGYVDVGRIGDNIAGLGSVGIEYQPALGGNRSLVAGANAYVAFDDYTDPANYAQTGLAPRTGLDAYVNYDFQVTENLSLGFDLGAFHYFETDHALALSGGRLDIEAGYELAPGLDFYGRLGMRDDRRADGAELIAGLEVVWTFGTGRSGTSNVTASSSGLVSEQPREPVYVSPREIRLTRPTRHVGYGNMFTPVDADTSSCPISTFLLTSTLQRGSGSFPPSTNGIFVNNGQLVPPVGSTSAPLALLDGTTPFELRLSAPPFTSADLVCTDLDTGGTFSTTVSWSSAIVPISVGQAVFPDRGQSCNLECSIRQIGLILRTP